MAEIKTPPVVIVVGGKKYVAFHEDHSLADLARWALNNPVDAEELVRLLQEGLK